MSSTDHTTRDGKKRLKREKRRHNDRQQAAPSITTAASKRVRYHPYAQSAPYVPARDIEHVKFGRFDYSTMVASAYRLFVQRSDNLAIEHAVFGELTWSFAYRYIANVTYRYYQFVGFREPEYDLYKLDRRGEPTRRRDYDLEKDRRMIEREETTGRYQFLGDVVLAKRLERSVTVLNSLGYRELPNNEPLDSAPPRLVIMSCYYDGGRDLGTGSAYLYLDDITSFFANTQHKLPE